MKRRGVCYDVGRVMWGQNWRPELSSVEIHRELQIIGDDLHCNAVRICGQDIERLVMAGQDALDQGLEVWLSPDLWDHSARETLAYIAMAAEQAERLRRRRPDQLVFSVGSEATLFMSGIVEGNSVFERLEHPSFWEHVRSGDHNEPLNAFLAEANDRVRDVFRGSVTYASVPFETVNWSPFDFVSVDLYREARIREGFADILRRFFGHDLPVAITEFGCCTYRGAADAGGRGFAILDITGGRDSSPAKLSGEYLRDEGEQAQELSEMIRIFDQAGVDATFVMTFLAPLNPTSADPMYDLDMASYSLVKSYGGRLGPLGAAHPGAPWERRRLGTVYPNMPWEPKASFRAVADAYALQAQRG